MLDSSRDRPISSIRIPIQDGYTGWISTSSLLKREAYSVDWQGLGERLEEAMRRRSLCTPTDCTQVAGGLRTWRSRCPIVIRAGILRAKSSEPQFSDRSVHLKHSLLLTDVKTQCRRVRGL